MPHVHPHDNTWCRAIAAIHAYWRRIFGRSPTAEVCTGLSWFVLAVLFLAALPIMLLWSLRLGALAMNAPFVPSDTFRMRKRDNVIHRQHWGELR